KNENREPNGGMNVASLQRYPESASAPWPITAFAPAPLEEPPAAEWCERLQTGLSEGAARDGQAPCAKIDRRPSRRGPDGRGRGDRPHDRPDAHAGCDWHASD